MKKNLIRILCLLLTMTFLFVGCNKGDDTELPDGNNDGEQGTDEGTGDGTGEGEGTGDVEEDPFAGLSKKEIQALHTVDFITYNIAYYDANDSQMTVEYEGQSASDYTIAKRQERLKTLIAHYTPDVIALQEVNYIWWPYLITNEDSLLNSGNYDFCGNKSGFGSTDGGGGSPRELYNLLFWDTEKFEAVETGHFWLTRTGRKYGDNNANHERMCTWAILRNKITGNETLYASTHLRTTGSATDCEKNLYEAKYLVQHLTAAAGDRPIVIGGDFNMSQNSEDSGGTYKYLVGEGGLMDARDKSKTRLNINMGSARMWGRVTNWATNGSPIDHVFFRGDLTGIKWTILPDTVKKDGTLQTGTSGVGKNYDISDHLGIYFQVREKLPETVQ